MLPTRTTDAQSSFGLPKKPKPIPFQPIMPSEYSREAKAPPRIVLGFVYAVAAILASVFVATVIVGVVRQRASLIIPGLFMCCSFAMFWSRVGRLLCRSLRRDRDRALKRNGSTQ